jgi:APA family basic amino acid/polyamine antiporter
MNNSAPAADLHAASAPRLKRELSLVGLIATAIAAMVGVGVNILPFMVQRSQPGVGAWVPLAYMVAAIPAILAALCYAALVSAMPRAGGSYVNISRALNPFAGFIASFSQWFGLSMAMGVVAYFLVPVFRDLLFAVGLDRGAAMLDIPGPRIAISILAIWLAWAVNVIGIRFYERSVVILAAITIVGPMIMTLAGALHGPASVENAGANAAGNLPGFTVAAFLGTAVVLFSSFIGFDAVSQAAGEARRAIDLAHAIVIAIVCVTVYYVCFTWSVYHAISWQQIYSISKIHDVSAPGLLAPYLPRWIGIAILASVVVAILKVLPALMLGNSRTLYAFSRDKVLPPAFSRVHSRFRTPHVSLTVTAIAGSLCVLGCNWAGDFFLGVDLLVLSMLVNFLLMAGALLTFPYTNPELYRKMIFLKSRRAQVLLASAAIVCLGGLLVIQMVEDLRSGSPWYLKSTTSWTIAMAGGCWLFYRFWARLRREGLDPRSEIFGELPQE